MCLMRSKEASEVGVGERDQGEGGIVREDLKEVVRGHMKKTLQSHCEDFDFYFERRIRES